jgi:hypothetical protein
MAPRHLRTLYPWKRFWCPSEGGYSLDDSGYLLDPELRYSRYVQSGVEPLAALLAVPCLALLGEPGSGESNDLDRERARIVAAAGVESVLSLDLKAFTDPGRLERLFFESPKFSAWQGGDGLLYLFLDSLDECIIHHRTVAALLLDRLRAVGSDALPRLRLRIACRTPAWPRQFDAEFPQLWGRDGFGSYELLPLRKADVAMACGAEGVDADLFLQAVAVLEAQPLANRPITLKPLLEAFRDRRELPATRMAPPSSRARSSSPESPATAATTPEQRAGCRPTRESPSARESPLFLPSAAAASSRWRLLSTQRPSRRALCRQRRWRMERNRWGIARSRSTAKPWRRCWRAASSATDAPSSIRRSPITWLPGTCRHSRARCTSPCLSNQ